MILSGVPEIADGGYWYVVPQGVPIDNGGKAFSGIGWHEWGIKMDGVDFNLVRATDPLPSVLSVKEVSTTTGFLTTQGVSKPYARVGGR